MKNIHVLKIGGGEGVDHSRVLHNLVTRIHHGENWVVVHGASAAANARATEYGYEVETITSPNGHVSRYTNAHMIEIYAAAARDVNLALCEELRQRGIHPYGFSEAGVIRGERKTAIRAIRNGRPVVIRDDYSGKITNIDTKSLYEVLKKSQVPIVAPIALGTQGEALNVDGDLVAAAIANHLGATTLMILSNVPGLLRDLHHPQSLISQISSHELDRYEDFAQGRMKKKLIAARETDIPTVILADSRIDNPIDAALAGGGTHITQENSHVEHYA